MLEMASVIDLDAIGMVDQRGCRSRCSEQRGNQRDNGFVHPRALSIVRTEVNG